MLTMASIPIEAGSGTPVQALVLTTFQTESWMAAVITGSVTPQGAPERPCGSSLKIVAYQVNAEVPVSGTSGNLPIAIVTPTAVHDQAYVPVR